MKIKHSKYYQWFNDKNDLDKVGLYRSIKDFIYSKYKKPLIFDVGCGQGFVSNYLNAVGFDINEYAISLAKKRYPGKRFFKIGSNNIILKRMNLKKSDVVICLNLIEHLKDDYRIKFMKNIIPKIVTENGYVIFSLHKQYNIFNLANMLLQRGSFFDPTHIHNWTENQFKSEVARYFEIIKVMNVASYTKLIPITKYLKTETLIITKLKK